MAAKPHVFLSYAERDQEWADQVAHDLQQHSVFDVFLDRAQLASGDNWQEELFLAVRRAQHMVLLWSPHASKSESVNAQLREFDQIRQRDRRRRLVVVLLTDEPFLEYAANHTVDLRQSGMYQRGRDKRNVEAWSRAIDSIIRTLQRRRGSERGAFGSSTSIRNRSPSRAGR
jgi:hypothetical protein